MTKLATAVALGIAVAASLGLASPAAATPATANPVGPGPAEQVATSLENLGYTVMFNGPPQRSLSGCYVTALYPTVAGPAEQFTPVYANLACPPSQR